MLRPVTANRLGPRIMTYNITVSGGTPTAAVGKDDLVSNAITDTGVGRYTATFKKQFSATGLGFVTNSTNGISNGYNTIASPALTGVELNALNASGTLVDNDLYGFVYGFDSGTIDSTSPQCVVTTKNNTRVLWGQLNGNPTASVVIGKKDFSISRAGSGDYTVTFTRAFARPPVVKVSAVGATFLEPNVENATLTRQSVRILLRNSSTGANADGVFNLVCFGQDSADEQGGLRSPLWSSQRKTRIICYRFTSNNSPSMSIGNSESSNLTRNSLGDFSITPMKPFARTPIVVTSSVFVANRRRTQVSASTTSSLIRVLNADAAASLAEGGSDLMQVFVIGSDDATEY